MKKLIVILVGLAMISVAKRAYSADNTTVDIVMTIQTVSIVRLGASAITVSALPGQSRKTDRAILKNDGSGNEDFSVRIASTAGSWEPCTVTGVVPQNQYRLRGVWAVWTATLTVADFNDNDIITSSNQASSSTVFFSETATEANVGNPAYDGGYNVAPESERSMFFRFDAGAAGTTGSSTAKVNVTATATP